MKRRDSLAAVFVTKTRVDGLQPGTRYYYRLLFGPEKETVRRGKTWSFRTLQGKNGTDPVSFAGGSAKNKAT